MSGVTDAEWLGRYAAPTPIRRLGAFFLYRAFEGGAPRVVAVSQSHVDPGWAEKVVDRVAEVHRAVDHPAVPPVVGQGVGDDFVYVAFGCDATHDFAHLLEAVEPPLKLPAGAATALLDRVLDVLRAHHRAHDLAGQPIHVGRFSAANLLLTPAGALSFVGLGTELLTRQGVGMPWQFEAPELEAVLAARRPSTATLDTWLVGAVARALRPLTRLTALEAQLELGATRVDATLAARWRGLWGRLESPEVDERYGDLEVLAAELRMLWGLVDAAPDPTALRRVAEASLHEAPTSAAAGTVVGDGRYRLERRLGVGRRGSLFLAFDQALGQPVVIKWTQADSPEEALRLKREVSILRQLRHPNVVGGFDLVAEDDKLGAVMEYVDGEPLSAMLERDVPRLQLAGRLAGVADALAYLRRQEVVHRDVKPQNVILHPERGAVLVDLGLARPVVTEHAITRPKETLGTYRYMAPEQLGNPSVGPAADVYAFCMMLLDVLANRPVEKYPPPDDARRALIAAGAPDALADLVALGLDLRPDARPRAEDLAGALRALDAPAADVESVAIGRDGALVRVDDQIIDLRRRRAMRLILAHLTRLLERAPGRTASVDELLEAGWPDEVVLPASGKARVYVAVSTLRKLLGLPELIERLDEGYRLNPDAPIRVVPPADLR